MLKRKPLVIMTFNESEDCWYVDLSQLRSLIKRGVGQAGLSCAVQTLRKGFKVAKKQVEERKAQRAPDK